MSKMDEIFSETFVLKFSYCGESYSNTSLKIIIGSSSKVGLYYRAREVLKQFSVEDGLNQLFIAGFETHRKAGEYLLSLEKVPSKDWHDSMREVY